MELRHHQLANSIQIHPTINDYSALTQAGFLKGLGALFGVLIGGFGFSTALTILFSASEIPMASQAVDCHCRHVDWHACNNIFHDHISSAVLTVFIISMVIKNFGMVFMGAGLLTESLK